MTEFNLVNLKQDIGLPGASGKLRKGKPGKDAEQMMPFVCVMGNACRATTQKTRGILPDPGPGKGKIGGRSGKGNAIRRGGAFNIDQENNILGTGKGKTNPSLNNILDTGKDKTGKTNQLLLVKGKSIAESSHGAGINPFMNTSKGKGTKTNRSCSGKINLLPERDGQKHISQKHINGKKIESLPVSTGLKKSETGINNVLGEDATGQMKQGLNKQSIESGLPKSGLIGVIPEKDETFKKSMEARVVDSAGENFRTGKTAIAVSKDGSLKAKIVDVPGLLKFSLKKRAAVAEKENNVKEPGRTEKKSFIPAKNDGSGNGIKNLLKHQGLKSIETAVEHEKTGIKEFSDHKIEALSRTISSRSHSVDNITSAGAYHHTSSGGSSAVVNESVNSSGIEPRALINQIANSVKIPGRVRITLNPPRLGALNVDVLVRDNKVHVILQAENNDVRQILQSNVESLKSAFRNHGLITDTINVLVQEKSDGSNYSANYRSGQNETLFKEGGNWGGNQENHETGQDSVIPDPSLFEEENPRVRSDGRVSLFA